MGVGRGRFVNDRGNAGAAGFGYYGSPYKNKAETKVIGDYLKYSWGVGMRQEGFFIDFAHQTFHPRYP